MEWHRSWPRVALWAALVVAGLFFWIPPLVRAVVGEYTGDASGAIPAAGSEAVRREGFPVGRPLPAVDAEAVLLTAGEESNASVGRELDIDPWVQSNEVAVIHAGLHRTAARETSPAHLVPDQEPLESRRQPGSLLESPRPCAAAPEGLRLASTLVGSRHRAAWINSKLFGEGSQVSVEGTVYVIVAIHPGRVILARDNEHFELRAARRPESLPLEPR